MMIKVRLNFFRSLIAQVGQESVILQGGNTVFCSQVIHHFKHSSRCLLIGKGKSLTKDITTILTTHIFPLTIIGRLAGGMAKSGKQFVGNTGSTPLTVISHIATGVTGRCRVVVALISFMLCIRKRHLVDNIMATSTFLTRITASITSRGNRYTLIIVAKGVYILAFRSTASLTGLRNMAGGCTGCGLLVNIPIMAQCSFTGDGGLGLASFTYFLGMTGSRTGCFNNLYGLIVMFKHGERIIVRTAASRILANIGDAAADRTGRVYSVGFLILVARGGNRLLTDQTVAVSAINGFTTRLFTGCGNGLGGKGLMPKLGNRLNICCGAAGSVAVEVPSSVLGTGGSLIGVLVLNIVMPQGVHGLVLHGIVAKLADLGADTCFGASRLLCNPNRIIMGIGVNRKNDGVLLAADAAFLVFHAFRYAGGKGLGNRFKGVALGGDACDVLDRVADAALVQLLTGFGAGGLLCNLGFEIVASGGGNGLVAEIVAAGAAELLGTGSAASGIFQNLRLEVMSTSGERLYIQLLVTARTDLIDFAIFVTGRLHCNVLAPVMVRLIQRNHSGILTAGTLLCNRAGGGTARCYTGRFIRNVLMAQGRNGLLVDALSTYRAFISGFTWLGTGGGFKGHLLIGMGLGDGDGFCLCTFADAASQGLYAGVFTGGGGRYFLNIGVGLEGKLFRRLYIAAVLADGLLAAFLGTGRLLCFEFIVMGELFERLYLFMTAARSFTGLGLAALCLTGGGLGRRNL